MSLLVQWGHILYAGLVGLGEVFLFQPLDIFGDLATVSWMLPAPAADFLNQVATVSFGEIFLGSALVTVLGLKVWAFIVDLIP